MWMFVALCSDALYVLFHFVITGSIFFHFWCRALGLPWEPADCRDTVNWVIIFWATVQRKFGVCSLVVCPRQGLAGVPGSDGDGE